MEGRGLYTFASGEKNFAEGWKKDKKNGKGYVIEAGLADGRRHDCKWENDKKNASGCGLAIT